MVVSFLTVSQLYRSPCYDGDVLANYQKAITLLSPEKEVADRRPKLPTVKNSRQWTWLGRPALWLVQVLPPIEPRGLKTAILTHSSVILYLPTIFNCTRGKVRVQPPPG